MTERLHHACCFFCCSFCNDDIETVFSTHVDNTISPYRHMLGQTNKHGVICAFLLHDRNFVIVSCRLRVVQYKLTFLHIFFIVIVLVVVTLVGLNPSQPVFKTIFLNMIRLAKLRYMFDVCAYSHELAPAIVSPKLSFKLSVAWISHRKSIIFCHHFPLNGGCPEVSTSDGANIASGVVAAGTLTEKILFENAK